MGGEKGMEQSINSAVGQLSQVLPQIHLRSVRFPVSIQGVLISPTGFSGSSAGKKNPPAIQETPVRFLGWEDLLEKG